MSDFDSAHPAVDDEVLDIVPLVRNQIQDLARGADPGAGITITNPPLQMKRFNTTTSVWERWDGASWVAMAALYDINVARLNGQPSSYYTNIAARLGYTPAPLASPTFTGTVTLPGETYFASQGGPEGGQLLLMKSGSDNVVQGPGVAMDLSDHGIIRIFEHSGTNRGFQLKIQEGIAGVGAKIWHSGLMGHTSGLDADTLDGVHANQLAFRLGEASVVTMDNATTGAIFTYFHSGLGTPDSGNHLSLIHNGGAGGLNSFQLSATLSNANDYYVRKRLAGTWQPWRKVLHEGNFDPATKLNLSGGQMTGVLLPLATAGTTIGNITTTGLEIRGTTVAALLFHKPGNHAVYLGLGEDNNLRIGGFSLGNTSYKVWSENNDGINSGLDADKLQGLTPAQVAALGSVASAGGTGDSLVAGPNLIRRVRGSANITVNSPDGNSIQILYTPGSGGNSSIHPDSKITMAGGLHRLRYPRGWKWLRDIRLGDVVRGEFGRPAKVVGIWRNTLMERALWEVNGVACTPGHLFLVDERVHGYRWGAASPKHYALNSHGKRRAVKTQRGVRITECLLADPQRVVQIEIGTRLLRADGDYEPCVTLESYSTEGEDRRINSNQEVIALQLEDSSMFVADGLFVATLA